MKFQQKAFDIGGEPSVAMIQDRDGFIWMGSVSSGLIRYDGYDIKKYKPGKNSVSSGWINSLYEDSDGIIWIGTSGGGLNRYDKTTGKITWYKHDPKDPKSIGSNSFLMFSPLIVEDYTKSNILWLGTAGGLEKLNKTTGVFTHYTFNTDDPNSISDNEVLSIVQDQNGIIWIGTKNGLNRFDPSTGIFTRIKNNPKKSGSISDNEVWSLLDDDTLLWIGTKEGKLNKFNKKELAVEDVYEFDMNILTLKEIKTGKLLLSGGVSLGGLIEFDKTTGISTKYLPNTDDEKYISSDGIRNIFEDNRGTIWITHNSGVVDKFDKSAQKFKLFKPNPKDSNSLVSDIAYPRLEDEDGDIWIGTTKGLTKYNPQKDQFSLYTHNPANKNSLPHNYPSSIYEDSEGILWVGAFTGGLVAFDKKKGVCTEKVDIPMIFTMAEDRDDPNILWAGTYTNGFYQYNKSSGEIVQYKNDPKDTTSISSNLPIGFIQDKMNSNIFWLATLGGGLEKFDKSKGLFTHYINNPNDSNTIVSNTVWNVHEDSNGIIWVCTDKGLDKFDKKSGIFKHYAEEQGFPGVSCQFSLEDENKNLWIGTEGGLAKFSTTTEVVEKVYTKNDGLHSHAFFVTGFCKSKDGTFWIGGFKGMNSFHPDSLKDNSYRPPVYLTSLTQGGEDIHVNSALEKVTEITLDWKTNFFEFEYAALNYTLSEKNQYMYKLDGLEPEWYRAGTNRKGRYSAIPSGTYTLRIRGSNNDGIWSNQEVALQVTVLSPPWRTWWAYTLYGLALFSAALGYFIYQKRQKRHLVELVEKRTTQLEQAKKKAEAANEAKSIFLSNMSHEIRTPMNAVLGFTEILRERITDPQNSKFLKTIQTSGNALLNLINDILDLSKIESGKIELSVSPVSIQDLTTEMQTIFFNKIDNKGLQFHLDVDNNIPTALIMDETRLRQILINLIGNAIKFTEEGSITLAVNFSEIPGANSRINLDITVQDTGIGIPLDQQKRIFNAFEQISGQDAARYGGTGLGLSISSRLTEIMGGKVILKSQPGEGTSFTISLPNIEISATEHPSRQAHTLDYSTIKFEPASVLITDDVDYNREMIATYLSDWNFTIMFAGNGKEAIATARESRPDIILMDMKMPVMDGFEAAQIIKSDETLKDIPLVAVTASAFKEDEEKITQLYNGYLRKPAGKSMLINELMKYLPHTTLEEKRDGADPVEITKVPAIEHLEKLHEMAISGYLQRIESYALELKQIDSELTPFADTLLNLAIDYDDDGIIKLIENYLNKLQ